MVSPRVVIERRHSEASTALEPSNARKGTIAASAVGSAAAC